MTAAKKDNEGNQKGHTDMATTLQAVVAAIVIITVWLVIEQL